MSFMHPKVRGTLPIVLTSLVATLVAVAVNLATDSLPQSWRPHLWLAWPAAVLLVAVGVALAVWQRDVDGETSHRARVPSSRSRPAQLPPDVADFTGRQHELASLSRDLAKAGNSGRPAIVVIDGKPGIGKSALAVHLARGLAREFPDGQLYANLRGAGSSPLPALQVLEQFLRDLGMSAEDVPDRVGAAANAFRSQLAGKRVLVMLDNAATEEQLRPLLPASAGSAVLITSRDRLAGLEGTISLTLELLPERDAVALLARLAGTERVDINPAAAASVVGHCGLLPLAVRIAGARLRARPSWPLAVLAARLGDERRRLTELVVGDLAVRASFELSYRDLVPDQARAFRLAGLLDGIDFSADAVGALTDVSVASAEAALEALVDIQLLETPAAGRYRFHDLLRLYARERAEADEPEVERQAANDRVLRWYVAAAAKANQTVLPPGVRSAADGAVMESREKALDWLEAERPNLVVVALRTAQGGPPAVTWELALSLREFLSLRAYLREWLAISQAAVRAAHQAGAARAEARALLSLSAAQRAHGHRDDAIRAAERALNLFRHLGDRTGEGAALGDLGIAYRNKGERDLAATTLERGVAISRESGDRRSFAKALDGLGSVRRDQGRFEEGTQLLTQSVAIYRELGDQRNEARGLRSLGIVLRDAGDLSRAVETFTESAGLSSGLGDRRSQAETLQSLAEAYRLQRRFHDALEAVKQGITISRELDDKMVEARCLGELGIVYREEGELDQSEAVLVEGIRIHERTVDYPARWLSEQLDKTRRLR